MSGFGSLGDEWEDPVLTPGQQLAGLAFTPRGGAVGSSPPRAVVCRGDAPYSEAPKDLGVVVPAAAVAAAPDGLGYYVAVEPTGVSTPSVRRASSDTCRMRTSIDPSWTWPCDPRATGTGRWRRMAACFRSGRHRSVVRERRPAHVPRRFHRRHAIGGGYWVATRAGDVLTFGDAVDFGVPGRPRGAGTHHRHALLPAGIRLLDGQRGRRGAGLRRHLLPRLSPPATLAPPFVAFAAPAGAV